VTHHDPDGSAYRRLELSKSAKLAAVLVAFVLAVAAIASVWLYLIKYPQTAQAATSSSGEQQITMQTVGALGYGPHSTYVSYLVEQNGKWIHSTMLQVKANSDVHFTIYQYDSGSPLRNPFMDQVSGTTDGKEILNGQPVRIVNDYSDGGVGHTFAIPSMGVSVPMPGISSNAKNPCGTPAPCALSYDHNTVQFTIHVGAAGTYPWQCFVPCGLGYLIGNGGPMSTLGYMGGFLKVVA